MYCRFISSGGDDNGKRKTADRKAFNVQNNFEKAIETEQKIMEKEILGEGTLYRLISAA